MREEVSMKEHPSSCTAGIITFVGRTKVIWGLHTLLGLSVHIFYSALLVSGDSSSWLCLDSFPRRWKPIEEIDDCLRLFREFPACPVTNVLKVPYRQ